MEIFYQSSSSLSLFINIDGEPADADVITGEYQVFVTITRLSDNVTIVTSSGADRADVGQYSYILDPNDNLILGKFKASWEYTYNGEVFPKTQYYDVVVPYTSAADLKGDFPELADRSNTEIYRKEKLARHIINTFCKQAFDFEIGTTRKLIGDNRDTLYLPKRIYEIDTVLVDNDVDISADIEIYSDFILRQSDLSLEIPSVSLVARRFTAHNYYWITGNWGWPFVPDDIQRATNLLIKDYFEDDSLLRQHGVYQATLGDEQYYFNNDLWNTTGNYDVDMLISNYTIFNVRVL